MSHLFCKHEWAILSETVTKSAFEMAGEVMSSRNVSNWKLPWQLCTDDRKHIQIVSCNKCGKLKRFVEKI